MRRPQSEDDGSVLKYVTEDELKLGVTDRSLYKFEEAIQV